MESVVTTPFADDFNLITRNKVIHQKLVTDIAEKIKSMGLELKPQTYRSLSIVDGKTENVTFKVKNKDEKEINIDSVIDRPMKLLGSKKHCQVEVQEKYFWTSILKYKKIC